MSSRVKVKVTVTSVSGIKCQEKVVCGFVISSKNGSLGKQNKTISRSFLRSLLQPSSNVLGDNHLQVLGNTGKFLLSMKHDKSLLWPGQSDWNSSQRVSVESRVD